MQAEQQPGQPLSFELVGLRDEGGMPRALDACHRVQAGPARSASSEEERDHGGPGGPHEEAADLQATYEKYKDKDVVFLGVDWTDIEGDALNYLKRFEITYANGPDLQTKIGPRYRISGVPETYVIDRDGNVQFAKISPITVAELSGVLDRVLDQK